jgi:hypothetical protein
MNWPLLHACVVTFWLGILGAEVVIERSRTESRAHGFSVARNHYWIDLLLELPAATLVLVTGFLLLRSVPLTPMLAAKVAAGVIAVGANVYCVFPVVQRKRAADAERLDDVIRLSRNVDASAVVGVPAAVLALALGLFLAR